MSTYQVLQYFSLFLAYDLLQDTYLKKYNNCLKILNYHLLVLEFILKFTRNLGVDIKYYGIYHKSPVNT